MKLLFPFLAAGLLAAKAASGAAGELTDAEKQGRALVAELLAEEGPTESYSQTGVLKFRDRGRHWTQISFRLHIIGTHTNKTVSVEITDPAVARSLTNDLKNAQATTPIAGSDLWVGDLGLEFLHWPEQRVLKSEMRRGRSCKVLESVNPAPTTNGYSRVVSWIDNETDGIVRAEAYDKNNKLFKECEPKGFKKVKGRWELREMRIRNLKTGSQTVMEFDLASK